VTSPRDLAELVEGYLDELALTPELGELAEPIRYALAGGGKRIRPVLCLATGQALGRDPEELLPAGAAVELVHNFSLVHDDLPALDNDELRRGRASTWAQFDEATAVLAGDALLTEAFRLALSYPTPFVARELVQATLGMIGGQHADTKELGYDLAEIHRLKTGRLFYASIACALWVAGLPALEQKPWREFADDLPSRRRHPRRRRLRAHARRGGCAHARRRGRRTRAGAVGGDRRGHLGARGDRGGAGDAERLSLSRDPGPGT